MWFLFGFLVGVSPLFVGLGLGILIYRWIFKWLLPDKGSLV